LKALHRGMAREFNSDRKETRWGQTEVEAGSMRPVLTRAITGTFTDVDDPAIPASERAAFF
jgi:hypothetical protein